MRAWEELPVFIALILAMGAVVVSFGPDGRQQVTHLVAEALRPQIADLGADPGYLSPTTWPLPEQQDPAEDE